MSLNFLGPFGTVSVIFNEKSSPGSEPCEMLENDDPYSTLAMFFRPQGLQNEANMLKKQKMSEESREEKKERFVTVPRRFGRPSEAPGRRFGGPRGKSFTWPAECAGSV